MIRSAWFIAPLLLVATPLAAQEAPAAGPLTVEGGLMFWTIVIFALLVGVLWKFAWPQILGAVEAREKALEKQIADAARNREESARVLEEQKKLLAEARTHAHQMLTEAQGAAERERLHVMEKARQEQEELLARGRRELEDERQRAVADLRREAVDLSLAAAGRLIRQRLDSDSDRKLVTDYLSTLEPQH
jgi:F-type H+-transporting ATPase subunit b